MAANDIRSAYTRFTNTFLVNLLIAAIFPLFLTIFGDPADSLLAFLGGFVVLSLFNRHYVVVSTWSLIFIGYLVWQIILSNINIAWLVLQPRPQLDPGIFAVPLRVRTGIEITMLASAISLTPGTLTIELQHNNGMPVLYIHAIQIRNPDHMRATVRDGFESIILRISNGVTS